MTPAITIPNIQPSPGPTNEQLFALFMSILLAWILFAWWKRRDEPEDGVLEAALNQANRGLAILNKEFRVVFWNPWLEKTFGLPFPLVRHCRLNDLEPFSPDHEVMRMLDETLRMPENQEFRIFRSRIKSQHGGFDKPLILTMNRFAHPSSGEPMILLIFREVEEAEQLRGDLQNLLKEAENHVQKMTEVDRLKSEFLAICSHELKTPLVSISGYLDLLVSEKLGPTTEKQKNALEISLRNVSRLNGLLSMLLEFARMEAGKLQFEFTPQRVSAVLEEVIGVIHPMANAKQIKLSLLAPQDLPHVYMDVGLLHRALLNLLDNAIKFTPQGGEIIIKAVTTGTGVKIDIADSGSGIEPDKIDKVREPFYQADASDKRKKGGLGLGLAIVEKILLGHGSKLEIDSTPEVGTKVSFTLKQAIPSASGRFKAFRVEE